MIPHRSRGVIATAVAMVLLAPLIARVAFAENDQDYPVTAADAVQVTWPPNNPAIVASPAARATLAANAAGIPASSPRADAPVAKAEPYYDPAAMMMSAPVASAPVKAMPASLPSPVAVAPPAPPPVAAPAVAAAPIKEPAPEASPAVEAALPPILPNAKERDALARPTFTTPAVPPINNSGDDATIENPELQEIPRAVPGMPQTAQPTQPRAQVNAVPEVDDLNAYMSYDASPQGLGSPGEYTAEGEEVSPIGLEMQQAHRRLKTGEAAGGLLILKVEKDSAAARAGLRPYRRAGHTVLEGIAIGAAMVFPPAILAVPVIDYTEVGESYDMIIGVDGSRVCNVLEFEDRMRNIQPGQTVYFNVLRNGRRIQVPVPIPALSTAATP